jgi:hypothetical protein
VEHYWLCDACSPYVTLTFEKERGIVTVPLPYGSGKKTVRIISGEQAANDLGTDGLSPENVREVL